jgi:L-asparaginase
MVARVLSAAGAVDGSQGTERRRRGFCGPGDLEPLQEAVSQGIIVVQSTRAGSGRTFKSTRIAKYGFLIADNLNPQKARLLLALALTVTHDPEEIARMFATY